MAANEHPEKEKKDNARQLLLEAARRLFTEKGYQEVSTRELADAAGVNLAAIQYHFGSKAQLFSEAVRSIMEENGCSQMANLLNEPVKTPAEAADRLFGFIQGYISELLRPRGPQACRIMFREMMSGAMENEDLRRVLVQTVVEHVTKPVDDLILGLLGTIFPQMSRQQLERGVQSIIGQCSFYVVHQPFVEYLRGVKCADTPYFEETSEHIFTFSMRGLGGSEELIGQTIANHGQPKQQLSQN